jgi:hypothetical protein
MDFTNIEHMPARCMFTTTDRDAVSHACGDADEIVAAGYAGVIREPHLALVRQAVFTARALGRHVAISRFDDGREPLVCTDRDALPEAWAVELYLNPDHIHAATFELEAGSWCRRIGKKRKIGSDEVIFTIEWPLAIEYYALQPDGTARFLEQRSP